MEECRSVEVRVVGARLIIKHSIRLAVPVHVRSSDLLMFCIIFKRDSFRCMATAWSPLTTATSPAAAGSPASTTTTTRSAWGSRRWGRPRGPDPGGDRPQLVRLLNSSYPLDQYDFGYHLQYGSVTRYKGKEIQHCDSNDRHASEVVYQCLGSA